MNGVEAIVYGALNSGVKCVTGVYGSPVSQLMEPFEKNRTPDQFVHWAANEKTAAEMCLGVSASGYRAMLILKQVGLNVAIDPLVIATSQRIGAGLVCIAGDEPSAENSQTAQDSRAYAWMNMIPVFEPCSPGEAFRAVKKAFRLSEIIRAPVMVRITSRLLRAKELTETATASKMRVFGGRTGTALEQHRKYQTVNLELNRYPSTLGLLRQYYDQAWPCLLDWAEREAVEFTGSGDAEWGIITTGFVSSIVALRFNGLPYLHLPVSLPLPLKAVTVFTERFGRILVLEEGMPLVETHLRAIIQEKRLDTRILGRETGHIPRFGEIEASEIGLAIGHINDNYASHPEKVVAANQDWAICDGCDFVVLFHILQEVVPPDILTPADAGCSMNGIWSHPGSVEIAYGLGAAIGVASGVAWAQGKAIAVIGDMAVLHSGINSLLHAVHFNVPVLVIVMVNDLAAQTGGQPHLGSTGWCSRFDGLMEDTVPIELEKLVTGCGVKECFCLNLETGGQKAAINLENYIRNFLASPSGGPRVILLRGRCSKYYSTT